MAGKKYTDQQKEEFFRLLDRGGTVSACSLRSRKRRLQLVAEDRADHVASR